jgi:hypothetical protein
MNIEASLRKHGRTVMLPGMARVKHNGAALRVRKLRLAIAILTMTPADACETHIARRCVARMQRGAEPAYILASVA